MTVAAMMMAGLLAASGAGDVVGTWKTETRNGVVEVTRCGASICGRLMSSDLIRTKPDLVDAKNKEPSLRTRPLKGLLLLQGFKLDGAAWTGGTIYNPDDGKTYSSTVELENANTLKVKGCVFVPLCKTQRWTRLRRRASERARRTYRRAQRETTATAWAVRSIRIFA